MFLDDRGATPLESGASVSTTIAAPISATATTGLIVYPMLALACAGTSTTEHIGGVRWSGSAWVDEPDPTQADLSWSQAGTGCAFPYNTTDGTITYPGGGKWFDSSSWFDAFATTDWANSGTAKDLAGGLLAEVPGQPGSMQNQVLLFKTQGGTICKWFFNSYGLGKGVAGAVECHGQGLDSF